MPERKQPRMGSTAFLGNMLAWSLVCAPVTAAEPGPGEIAGAIRSADYPCAHVLEMNRAGENTWLVQCNSGQFKVSRNQDGGFSVTQTAGKAEQ